MKAAVPVCVFCRIIAKEVPAEHIYEDDCAIAFLDADPRSLGHTLIVPKRHFENLLDVPHEEVPPLFLAVQSAIRLLQDSLRPAGFTIGINHGSVSGQSVDHLHVHAIPRYSGDGGGSVHAVVDSAPAEPVRDTARRIRSNET